MMEVPAFKRVTKSYIALLASPPCLSFPPLPTLPAIEGIVRHFGQRTLLSLGLLLPPQDLTPGTIANSNALTCETTGIRPFDAIMLWKGRNFVPSSISVAGSPYPAVFDEDFVNKALNSLSLGPGRLPVRPAELLQQEAIRDGDRQMGPGVLLV